VVLAGLETVTVGPGQMVGQGQPIGRMGKGDGAPPEFYLEIRRNGAPVDPSHWLKAPLAKS